MGNISQVTRPLVFTGEPVRPVVTASGLFLIAAAIGLLAVTLANQDRPTVAVVWGSVALTTYLAGLLRLTGRRYDGLGISRWKIGPWILMWYGIAFGLVTVAWSQPQPGTASEIAVSSVLRALWVVAVGTTALCIGYQVGLGRPIALRAERVMSVLRSHFGPVVRSSAAPWVLYGIGTTARLLTAATTGRLGYLGNASLAVSSATGYAQFLSTLSNCAPLAVAAAGHQAFRDRLPGSRVTLLVLFLAEVAFGAVQGVKGEFVITALAVAIPFSAAHRRLPKMALSVLVLAFLLVVIPFSQVYRSSVREGSVTLTPAEAIGMAPSILGESAAGIGTALPTSAAYLAQRVREIDDVAIIVQRTPNQVPFQSPSRLIADPLAGMIPREIWPSKPINLTGYEFGQKFFGLPSSAYTSTPDTMPGSLYWDGGWISLITGMFLLGCGVRLLDRILDARADPHAMFLILLLLPVLAAGEEDWTLVLASLPAVAFTWLVAAFVTFGRPRGLDRRVN
jgi:hypothetical protein